MSKRATKPSAASPPSHRTHVLLDTGPLVAFLNARDAHHAWAKERLATIAPPLATCEAVLSETCFLVRATPAGPRAVFDLVATGLITVPFRLADEATAVAALMRKYANVPMSLADACLVRMAELDAQATVLTLDDDFRVYRKHGRHVVPVLAP